MAQAGLLLRILARECIVCIRMPHEPIREFHDGNYARCPELLMRTRFCFGALSPCLSPIDPKFLLKLFSRRSSEKLQEFWFCDALPS